MLSPLPVLVNAFNMLGGGCDFGYNSGVGHVVLKYRRVGEVSPRGMGVVRPVRYERQIKTLASITSASRA